MGKTFAALDDGLIEHFFQPLSDLISCRIGLGRTGAACLCIDFAALSWIASRARGLSDAAAAWNATTAFLDLSFLLLGLVAMIGLRTVFRRAGCKPTNPLRSVMQPHRAVVLLMLVSQLVQLRTSGLAELADCAMLTFAAFAMYLGACAERPPVRRQQMAPAPVG